MSESDIEYESDSDSDYCFDSSKLNTGTDRFITSDMKFIDFKPYPHIYDPFYEYRSPENIRDTLVLDDTTNDRVIKQHDGGKDDEFSGKEFNLEPKSFRKTCLHHDALGNPFPCGNRTFNSENAYQECEDNSLSERSCDNICCENPQESFIIN